MKTNTKSLDTLLSEFIQQTGEDASSFYKFLVACNYTLYGKTFKKGDKNVKIETGQKTHNMVYVQEQQDFVRRLNQYYVK